MNWKKTGSLFFLAAALGLVGCRSKTTSNGYQALECAQGTESLQLDLKNQIAQFTQDLRAYQSGRLSATRLSRSANQTLDLCREFDRSFNEQAPSCMSYDAFSGNGVEIQRDSYQHECELAHQYSTSPQGNDWRDHDWKDREDRRGGWADKALKDLSSREIALYVADSKALSDVLKERRNPKAFVNGRAVSYPQAQAAAKKGQTSCAVRVSNGRFIAERALPVVKITVRPDRDTQSITLVTKEGLQLSCQLSRRRDMTSRDVQQALGTIIQVRH